MAAKPVPDRYHTVTPYLTVDDAALQIDFLKRAFNAQVNYEMKDPQGNVRHAEVRVGDSILMIGQARDEWTSRPMTFYLYVPDVDALYKSALAAGRPACAHRRQVHPRAPRVRDSGRIRPPSQNSSEDPPTKSPVHMGRQERGKARHRRVRGAAPERRQARACRVAARSAQIGRAHA